MSSGTYQVGRESGLGHSLVQEFRELLGEAVLLQRLGRLSMVAAPPAPGMAEPPAAGVLYLVVGRSVRQPDFLAKEGAERRKQGERPPWSGQVPPEWPVAVGHVPIENVSTLLGRGALGT